jgi:hypothetical protein
MLDLVFYKKNIINIKLLSNFKIFYVKVIFSHKQVFIELIKNNNRYIVLRTGMKRSKRLVKLNKRVIDR